MTKLTATDFDIYADESPDPLYVALMAGDTGEITTTLEAFLARPAWHALAACRGVGPETFFPERGQSLEPARQLCAGCPVATECIESASGDPFGVWGGLSAQQRKKLSRDAA